MTNAQKNAIGELLQKGFSYAKISRKLKLPYNSIKSFS